MISAAFHSKLVLCVNEKVKTASKGSQFSVLIGPQAKEYEESCVRKNMENQRQNQNVEPYELLGVFCGNT